MASLIFLFLLIYRLLPFTYGIVGGSSCRNLANNAGSGTVVIRSVFETSRFIFCSGALISELFVLTNNACYSNGQPSIGPTVVIISSTTPFENGQMHYVIDAKVVGGAKEKHYRLMVLMLDRRARLHVYGRPYALPADDEVLDHSQQGYFFYGFGTTEIREPPNYFKGSEMEGLATDELQRIEFRSEGPLSVCLQQMRLPLMEKNDTRYFCYGPSMDRAATLTWADIGGPLVGATDNVLMGIACLKYEFNTPSNKPRDRNFWFINVAPSRPAILAAMKQLMEKNRWRIDDFAMA